LLLSLIEQEVDEMGVHGEYQECVKTFGWSALQKESVLKFKAYIQQHSSRGREVKSEINLFQPEE
jgi:hypothetical protein